MIHSLAYHTHYRHLLQPQKRFQSLDDMKLQRRTSILRRGQKQVQRLLSSIVCGSTDDGPLSSSMPESLMRSPGYQASAAELRQHNRRASSLGASVLRKRKPRPPLPWPRPTSLPAALPSENQSNRQPRRGRRPPSGLPPLALPPHALPPRPSTVHTSRQFLLLQQGPEQSGTSSQGSFSPSLSDGSSERRSGTWSQGSMSPAPSNGACSRQSSTSDQELVSPSPSKGSCGKQSRTSSQDSMSPAPSSGNCSRQSSVSNQEQVSSSPSNGTRSSRSSVSNQERASPSHSNGSDGSNSQAGQKDTMTANAEDPTTDQSHPNSRSPGSHSASSRPGQRFFSTADHWPRLERGKPLDPVPSYYDELGGQLPDELLNWDWDGKLETSTTS